MMEVRTIKDIAYEFSDGILMLVCALWQYWLWSFQGRDTKLERFWAKNEHTQRKWFILRIEVVASCQKLGIILHYHLQVEANSKKIEKDSDDF